MQQCIFVLVYALVLDAIIGDPKWFWRYLPHPVMLFGKCIHFLEKKQNKKRLSSRQQKINGLYAIALLSIIAIFIGFILQNICVLLGLWGVGLEIIIVACFLAQKSLYNHVFDVYNQFNLNGIKAARYAVSMIVGRNPNHLDEAAIARAAIESLAENSSDGVVAPIFFYVLFGLPGLLFYKMVNTADSMIGHKNERYFYYGYGAAKLDDIVNFLPARITAFIALCAVFIRKGIKEAQKCFLLMMQDAPKHRSPNGGWPESIYAAFLGIKLSGPRIYDNVAVNDPILNNNGRDASIGDIEAALHFFKFNMKLLFCAFLLFLLILLS